jgi:UDP-glucose 4-epimerase
LELIRSGARDRTVNVGSGRGVTVSELARLAEAVSGKRINLVEAPIRLSDVLTNALDVSALNELTGFTPAVTLEAGLVRTWEHLSKP